MDQRLKDEIAAKVDAGERLSRADGEALYACDDLAWLGGLAHGVRTRMNGDRVFFNINQTHSVWGAVSRAVRTPSRTEQDMTLDAAVLGPSAASFGLPVRISVLGDRNFESEDMLAYESGYRLNLGRVSVDLAAFYNSYSHLLSAEPTTPTLDISGPTVHLMAPLIADIPIGLISSSADEIAFVIVTLVIALLSIVVGELVPKTLALNFPERLALLVARPIGFLQSLLSPVVWLVSRLSTILVRLLGGKETPQGGYLSTEELKLLVETGSEQGGTEEEEKEMFPMAERKLGAERSRELAEAMAARAARR